MQIDALAVVVLGSAGLQGGRSEKAVEGSCLNHPVAARFSVVGPSEVDALRATIAEMKSQMEDLERKNSELQKKACIEKLIGYVRPYITSAC